MSGRTLFFVIFEVSAHAVVALPSNKSALDDGPFGHSNDRLRVPPSAKTAGLEPELLLVSRGPPA